jgi:hypothetical protein
VKRHKRQMHALKPLQFSVKREVNDSITGVP